MTEEKLLTPTDVAERLQLQERTVTRWLRTGNPAAGLGVSAPPDWLPSRPGAIIEALRSLPEDTAAEGGRAVGSRAKARYV